MKNIFFILAISLLMVTTAYAAEFAPTYDEPVFCPHEDCLYTYKAEVLRWVDGDTVDLSVDLGFTVKVHQRFRLYDTSMYIDTPERGQKNFKEATELAESIHPVGSTIIIQSGGETGKYGRYFVYLPKVNAALLKAGYLKDPHRYD